MGNTCLYGWTVVMLGLLAIETEVPLAHKNKQTVYKADHFTRYGSAEEARKRKCGETEPKMSGITCSMQVQVRAVAHLVKTDLDILEKSFEYQPPELVGKGRIYFPYLWIRF
ncbi:hypothetical protein Tco_0005409 [Tanacetum coccineum]